MLQEVYDAATWESQSTFYRFYKVNVFSSNLVMWQLQTPLQLPQRSDILIFVHYPNDSFCKLGRVTVILLTLDNHQRSLLFRTCISWQELGMKVPGKNSCVIVAFISNNLAYVKVLAYVPYICWSWHIYPGDS